MLEHPTPQKHPVLVAILRWFGKRAKSENVPSGSGAF
jgi:hypothetical protein